MKKRLQQRLLTGILILTSIALQAQIPSGYYNNAANKTGEELKNALHNIVKGHKSVSYSGLLNAFSYTDSDSNGKVWDIYSNNHYSFSNNCGSYDNEGDCWNREHTWPQSWFDGQTTPKCDLFHVYPTDGFVNGQRSNYPYGEVNRPTYTSGNGSKLGPCVTPGYSGTVFEPIDEYKGDIARSYFYMSVRYSGEDSGWGTSGMTNKSNILDWAMTMLLRWSDEDPVSDKEIARNNAVYGFQKNRNPFIDHPEYAHMIWDPNWTATESYEITCATNISHGSISAPATAYEGSTVAITAIPDAGYMVNSYSVYKTGDANTTVTVTSNGTFTMPSFPVTVSATFVQNNNYYTITTAAVTHGSINVSASSAKSGTTITMNATPSNGYSLYSWYVYKTDDINTNVYTGTTGSFIMPAFNVTVYATFSTQGASSNGDFVKVTEDLDDWSGEYLIVYEDGLVAFDGGLGSLDAVSNTINVTINNDMIEATQDNLAARFIITPLENNTDYSIKSISGYYIGQTSDANGMQANLNTVYTNTISYSDNEANIVSANAHLRYNATSGQTRFRYYKSATYTGQKAIQLYKRTSTVEAPTHSIHFEPNGGEGSMNDQTVEEYIPTVLTSNAFVREGFEFDGWNTQANGEGTYYADGATVALLDDITLWAQWNPKYTITLGQPLHGSISANPLTATEDATITLTATPDTGYELNCWTVTDENGNTIEVVENQFDMPASNVTVNATFIAQPILGDAYYVKVTETPTDWTGEYLIVCENKSVAFNGTIESNWGRCSEVTISNDTIESNSTTDEFAVTISISDSDSCIFQFPNGNYMNWTEAKKFSSGENAINYALSISDGNAIILHGSNVLKYNYNNGTGGLRSYAATTTTNVIPIQLYKKVFSESPATIEQTVTLNKGWNWWSPNLNIDLEQLEIALGNHGCSINSQTSGVDYLEGLGWDGDEMSIEPSKMYKIRVMDTVEIILSGTAIDPADQPITVKQGSNWIGFPLSQSMSLSEAFADLHPEKNDVVKTPNGYGRYIGSFWIGTLKQLEPNKGYIYKSNATTIKTFTYPAP